MFKQVRPPSVYLSTSFLRLVWAASFVIEIPMPRNSRKRDQLSVKVRGAVPSVDEAGSVRDE
jgi:hypothetical protein